MTEPDPRPSTVLPRVAVPASSAAQVLPRAVASALRVAATYFSAAAELASAAADLLAPPPAPPVPPVPPVPSARRAGARPDSTAPAPEPARLADDLAATAARVAQSVPEPEPEPEPESPAAPAAADDDASTYDVSAEWEHPPEPDAGPAPEPVAEPSADAEAPPPEGGLGEPAVPGWDELSLASIRGRLRRLDLDQLEQLHAYELAHAARPAVVSMLAGRIARVRAGTD